MINNWRVDWISVCEVSGLLPDTYWISSVCPFSLSASSSSPPIFLFFLFFLLSFSLFPDFLDSGLPPPLSSPHFLKSAAVSWKTLLLQHFPPYLPHNCPKSNWSRHQLEYQLSQEHWVPVRLHSALSSIHSRQKIPLGLGCPFLIPSLFCGPQ